MGIRDSRRLSAADSEARQPLTITRRTLVTLAGMTLLTACSSRSTQPPLNIAGRKMFYGAAMPPGQLGSFEREVGGRLSCHRTFFEGGQEQGLVDQARADVRIGRAPLVSIKPPGSWAATADDPAWIDSLVEPLSDVRGPVFLILHHEPEDDAGRYGEPADYVAMQRAALRRAALAGHNVHVVPVLSTWSFDPDASRHPGDWNVPEAEIYGLDLYNPWSPTNGKPWQPFDERLALATPLADGRPILVGEYGCRTDDSQPGRAAGWLQDAFTHALGVGVIAMSYFNSYRNTRDESWELDSETLPVFAQILGEAHVATIRSSWGERWAKPSR
jgi:hypothetical protein